MDTEHEAYADAMEDIHEQTQILCDALFENGAILLEGEWFDVDEMMTEFYNSEFYTSWYKAKEAALKTKDEAQILAASKVFITNFKSWQWESAFEHIRSTLADSYVSENQERLIDAYRYRHEVA